MAPISVFLLADDPVCQAGLAALLTAAADIELTDGPDIDASDVVVVFVDRVGSSTPQMLRALQRDDRPRTVLIATEIDGSDVAQAAECGVTAVLRRGEATVERLTGIVRAAAAGDGFVPSDLLGGLLRRIHTAHSRGEPLTADSLASLSVREAAVLQMISDGCETREIAHRLAYSERTVKNVIQDVVQRLGVRNRPQAVAYAMRNGLLQ